jgi:hypothetical protein
MRPTRRTPRDGGQDLGESGTHLVDPRLKRRNPPSILPDIEPEASNTIIASSVQGGAGGSARTGPTMRTMIRPLAVASLVTRERVENMAQISAGFPARMIPSVEDALWEFPLPKTEPGSDAGL